MSPLRRKTASRRTATEGVPAASRPAKPGEAALARRRPLGAGRMVPYREL